MAELYADENFDLQVVDELRCLGHDVLTIQEAGKSGLRVPDDIVLDDAHALGRTVLTFNHWHFQKLHRSGIRHSGIVSCTRDSDSKGLAARIDRALSAAATLADQFLRIVRPSKP